MAETSAGAVLHKPFRILTVCTGNICRSPMSERLLQAGLDKRYPAQFVVRSAGTGALVGNVIDAQVASFIHDLGGSADHFSARQLTPDILQDQDLILALTREHRSRVVEMDPSKLKKTFTLREFARLLPLIQLDESLHGAERWRAALPRVLRARSARSGPPENDDVIDPYRRSDDVYQQMHTEISSCIRSIFDRDGF